MEFASFTTDLWSSNNNTDYLSLSCHFLGEDIYTFTIETLEKWGIKEKQIHVFLRDNAPNMVKAFSNREFLGLVVFHFN